MTVTSVDPKWLAELGGVFYSVKEKGMSARDKRVTEQEINRKIEIETQMAEDKEREAKRLIKIAEVEQASLVKPLIGVVKKISVQGAVRRPVVGKIRRGF